MIEFRNGDVFTWKYKPEEEDRRYNSGVHTAYWCKSRIAIVKDGQLIDTYWHGGGDSSVLDIDQIELEFQCNANEATRINRWERNYYRPEDVMDMSHPNNSGAPVYLKADAKRDPDIMRDFFRHKIECAESDVRMAQSRADEYRNALADVETGRVDGHFPFYS